MGSALREAVIAQRQGEVPVGAVLVKGGRIISRGHNCMIQKNDPAAHAEIVALRKAGKRLGTYRLTDATLYATIEPCPMCAGALIQARVKKIVFGARDPKTGACGSALRVVNNRKLNHRIAVTSGVLRGECSVIIRDFFRSRRKRKK